MSKPAGDAAARWRTQLEAWAIPEELLAAVPDSPYGWPAEHFRRRAALGRDQEEPYTTLLLRRLLGPEGTLLDVGAGTGRASLPLAAEGIRVTAVERNPGMLKGLRAEALALGVMPTVVEGSWPEVAGEVGVHDVALAAHVVYDVQDLVPFLAAMAARVSNAVVLELTASHPWTGLGPLYRSLHGLDRPAGPTADDLVALVEERFEMMPEVEPWSRPPQLWFEDWDEILGFYGRRLVLPRERWGELRRLLASQVVERDGRLFVGVESRQLVTMWWVAPRRHDPA